MHSFDPSTRVLLADGSTKPIKEIRVGDEVVATDPKSGSTEAKPVTQLHINIDTELTDVTVQSAKTGTSSVLKTTAHHPVWDATTAEWVDASKLAPGHRLLVAHDDKRLEGDNTGAGSGGGGPPAEDTSGSADEVVVLGVLNHTGSQVMRDLTIADIHTYYVIAADQPILVHNTSPVGTGGCRVPAGQPGGGQFARAPGSAPATHTRGSEYPHGYSSGTHEAMVIGWTDEGRAAGAWPTDPITGARLPRLSLTWRDGGGQIIPADELTYDHSPMVVQHWNSTGYDQARSDRAAWYDNPAHLTPMRRGPNSSAGASSPYNMRQDTGPNYS